MTASLLLGVLVWLASSQLLYPFWYAPGLARVDDTDFAFETWAGLQHPDDLGLRYEDVTFPASDGDSLAGWWIPLDGARATVVTVHGGGSDRRDFLRHVPFLRDAGHNVLLFDCREHGASTARGRGLGGGLRESEDVSAAVTFLANRGFGNVAVLGMSQGASSALIAAARDERIRAVVAENPVAGIDTLIRQTVLSHGLPIPDLLLNALHRLTFWRMGTAGGWEALDVVHEIAPTPILFIHGLSDVVVPPHHSELLIAAAHEPKAVWWVPDGEHMRLINRAPREYEERVTTFLRERLGSEPTGTRESSRFSAMAPLASPTP